MVVRLALAFCLATGVANADFIFGIPTTLGPTTCSLAMGRTPCDYTVSVGSEQIHFVPQPDAGYVVKLQEERTSGIGALSGLSSLELAQAATIRGPGRKGVYVVERQQPAGQNEKTIKVLAADSLVKYAAPLFFCQGETVGIIPEIVARLKEGAAEQDLAAVCQSMHLRIKKRMDFTTQEYLLEVLRPDAEAVFAALDQINRIDWIEWAAPNIAFKPQLCGRVMPSDPGFSLQWHLHNTGQLNGTPGADIKAPTAWEITTGDPNIIVALLDTGIDTKHPDLVNNLVPGYDFFDDDNDPSPALNPFDAHGTACAGLLAAQGNNGFGITGVTWNCRIMPIRTSRTDWTTADVAATAFRWAANNGADILSCSLVMSDSPIVDSAIVDVTKLSGIGRNGKGCIIVAAAGNANARVDYPARHPDVIAVGATDNKDKRWYYSNFGSELEIVAPSGGIAESDHPGIYTTDIAGSTGFSEEDYFFFGGTSGACPIVAGVAALILSINPNLANDDVRRILHESAVDLGTPGRDNYYGYGRIDAAAALYTPSPDFNGNGKVDFKDYCCLAQYWSLSKSSVDIGPRPRGDGKVDLEDVAAFAEYWLTDFVIAHWKLDETEGTVAHDSVGGRDGTLIGGPVWQPTGGKVDGALQFDGTDDYVNAGFVLDPANGAFSAFAWMKGGQPGGVIISQADGTGFGGTWLGTNASDGKLITNLMFFEMKSGSVVTDDTWHDVAIVWDGSRRYLYVDGKEVAKDTADMTAILSDGNLYIGAGKKPDLDPTSFFSGLIDDVRIYDRAIIP